jgi:hypothetical protein
MPKLTYKILEKPGKRFVYLYCDPPQTMDADEVFQWMKETRDDDPDLYAELVHIYFLLRKTPLPH